MGMTATTIKGFRAEMRASAQRWYEARGLAGPRLFAFQKELQALADHLGAAGKSKDEIKAALAVKQADLLRSPFNPTPIDDGSYVVLHPKPTPAEVKQVRQLLFQGEIGAECHYAGLGARLESKKPKFMMSTEDLLAALTNFAQRINDPAYAGIKLYESLAGQIAKLGGLAALQVKFTRLQNWAIGERIFLAKIYGLYRTARQAGMSDDDFRQKVKKQKFKVVINQESGGPIIEAFVKNRFFGLDPRNLIFMYQVQHPTHEVKKDGALAEDENHKSQGNHGLVPLQSVLEAVWFQVVPNRADSGYQTEKIAAADLQDFQEAISVLSIESVEDTTQYVWPYDEKYLAIVDQAAKKAGGARFFMKIVGNKPDNPQKGGALGSFNGRNGVIESQRLPDITPAQITLLNLNNNAVAKPNEADQLMLESPMIEDLHPIFEPQGSDSIVRIDIKIPQGDRNLYLPSRFIRYEPTPTISNLKDPVDIIKTLLLMEIMEADSGVIAFARDFLGLPIKCL